MSENFKKIIQDIILMNQNYPFDKDFMDFLHSEQLKIDYADKNELLISNEMPSNNIYLLLDGFCSAEKYSPAGKLLTSVAAGPVQIYGLYEAVHPTLTMHTTTIRCMTHCAYIRIPRQKYINHLLSDPQFSWVNLQYLSLFIDRALTENDNLLLNNTKQKLLLRLYQYCANRSFPVVVTTRKEELAQLLNISLRTLYRQLDILYKEGILSSTRGKILITKKQYLEIQELLSAYF